MRIVIPSKRSLNLVRKMSSRRKPCVKIFLADYYSDPYYFLLDTTSTIGSLQYQLRLRNMLTYSSGLYFTPTEEECNLGHILTAEKYAVIPQIVEIPDNPKDFGMLPTEESTCYKADLDYKDVDINVREEAFRRIRRGLVGKDDFKTYINNFLLWKIMIYDIVLLVDILEDSGLDDLVKSVLLCGLDVKMPMKSKTADGPKPNTEGVVYKLKEPFKVTKSFLKREKFFSLLTDIPLVDLAEEIRTIPEQDDLIHEEESSKIDTKSENTKVSDQIINDDEEVLESSGDQNELGVEFSFQKNDEDSLIEYYNLRFEDIEMMGSKNNLDLAENMDKVQEFEEIISRTSIQANSLDVFKSNLLLGVALILFVACEFDCLTLIGYMLFFSYIHLS